MKNESKEGDATEQKSIGLTPGKAAAAGVILFIDTLLVALIGAAMLRGGVLEGGGGGGDGGLSGAGPFYFLILGVSVLVGLVAACASPAWRAFRLGTCSWRWCCIHVSVGLLPLLPAAALLRLFDAPILSEVCALATALGVVLLVAVGFIPVTSTRRFAVFVGLGLGPLYLLAWLLNFR